MTTDSELYGTGLAFGERWDFSTDVGSLDVIEGDEVLARDLAFATTRELTDDLNQLSDPNLLEEVDIEVRRVATRDSRVDRVVSTSEEFTEDNLDRIDIEMTLIAGDERGEFIFQVAP